MLSKSSIALIACLITNTAFGLTFLFTRQALYDVSVLSLLSWRFSLAFVAMTLLKFCGILKINLKGRSLKPLFLIGIFHPILYFVGETVGIGLTSTSEAGVIIATMPIVTMLLAVLILREMPTRLQAVSIIVSVIGVCVVVLGRHTVATLNPLGYAALAVAVLAGALFFITSRRAADYSSAEKTYVMMGMGFVVFTSAALVEHISQGTVRAWLTLPIADPWLWLPFVYLGIVTSIFGFMLQNYSIAVLGVNRVSSLAGFVTIVTIVAGVLVLNETFTFTQGVGTALIILGATGANYVRKKPTNQSPPT